MPDWLIGIVTRSGSVMLDPQNGELGGPLTARAGDTVRWRNKTGQRHQPWRTDAKFKPMSEEDANKPGNRLVREPILRHDASTSNYAVLPADKGKTIYYCCKLHENDEGERGQIVVRP